MKQNFFQMKFRTMVSTYSLTAFCFAYGLLQSTVAQYTAVKVHVGQVAELPCRVDTAQCGKLHSVKWYRDTSRIYVFSQVGGIKRGEGDATERMEVEYEPSSTKALLRIFPVEIEDDADYKCEITYWEVREHCDIVQIIRLTTLVAPDAVRIIDEKGVVINNGSKLQPADEGTRIALRCEVHGGKPAAQVSWYRRGDKLKAASSSVDTADGLSTSLSTLNTTLSRSDLSTDYTCLVESEALGTPIKNRIYPDVQVRPTSIELNGLKDYAYQGDEVVATCIVRGAKPAANVEWRNSTELMEFPTETKFQEVEDGTFTTTSNLKLKFTRFDNDREFQCLTQNKLMTNNNEAPLQAGKNITVYYPPFVTMKPAKVTTFENSSVLLYCEYSANPKTLSMVLWQKDGKNLTLTEDKFEGGTTDHPSLIIKQVSRNDMGMYLCFLRNSVDISASENGITLNVTHPPAVEVLINPDRPVREEECINITIHCKISSGNPRELEEVKWYINDDLAHKTDCSRLSTKIRETNKCGSPTKCNINSSLILLERVQRSLSGRYSCQGKNAAGWGLISAQKELLVYYPPHATRIKYTPSTVIKGSRVKLKCDVDDPGSPSNISFQWYKGNYLYREKNASEWLIDSVTLSDRTNFTCFAANNGGRSQPSTVYVNVLAPPAFIQKPAPYYGILASAKNVSLTCQIECYPPCSIKWLKNGKYLETRKNSLFQIIDTIHPADLLKNDFESIESTLVFNVNAWESLELEGSDLTTKYTCRTEGNGVGPNITADVEIEVEFPPEDIVVSSTNVKVAEHERPPKIKCSGRGRPNLSYSWTRSGSSENISFGELLQLGPMLRTDSGAYVCNAWNKHGTSVATVNFDVLYPPECTVKMAQINNNPALICTAIANPDIITFVWKSRLENYTLEIKPKLQDNLSSYVVLDTNFRTLRTYTCYANNSVGESSPCEIDIPGNISWWQQLDTDTVVLIIASVISIVICSTVICVIIVLLCKRKGSNDKHSNQMEMEEREKFLCSHSPDVLGLPLVTCGKVKCLGRPVPHHFSTAEKAHFPTHQQDNLSLNLNYTDQDKKALYENLPFHDLQHPSNNKNAFYTLTTSHCKHLNSGMNQQYSVTLPHPKHKKLTSRDLQLSKSKTFSSKAKHKKTFELHLQNSHSLRFQTQESCFQTINNVAEQNVMNNGQTNYQRFKKKKQNVDRSLGDLQFQENMEHCVQFEYPQLFSAPHRSDWVNGTKYTDVKIIKKDSVYEDKCTSNDNNEFMPEIVLDSR